jgi:putative nucleotidyltransferase with HDIG domain
MSPDTGGRRGPAQLPAPAAPGPTSPVRRGRPGTWARDPEHQFAPAAARLVATGLEAAVRLRAPRVHASTPSVRRLVVDICEQLGLDERELKLAALCATVRDVGVIALPDTVVRSSSGLSPEQWQLINRHPIIGAELLETVPGLEITAPIVRSHHERWDGGGYPDGLAGEAVPLLSRVIAAADAFVAVASDRPHRSAAGADMAREHIAGLRGTQFDPHVVDALLAVVDGRNRPSSAPRRDARAAGGGRLRPTASPGRSGPRLGEALGAVDQLPAFTPAYERALAASASAGLAGRDLVEAVEASAGLTVAVLRAVQETPSGRGIANVPDAVRLLGAAGVAAAIGSVPCVPFPWETAEQALLYQIRVHGHAVARAAQRIATETGFRDPDDLIAAALLHDVGKLVVAGARGRGVDGLDEASATPERRVQSERRELRVDHAGLGAVLIERWGLPTRLALAVRDHHSADAPGEIATLLRLADMAARHSQGHLVDRQIMLRLSGDCGLSVSALRTVLFDLPQSGSRRRRAEPSPLSKRETDALRQLAEGKLYKEIAATLGVSASTIRSHLHSAYAKLGVEDRAQAVLLATEMGWL